MKKAVILLGGGIDSTTVLAMVKQEGYDCYTLSFDYGQRHRVELDVAKKMAKMYQVKEHKVVCLDLSFVSTSPLVNEAMDVPDYTGKEEITTTYVPARNTIFLSYALAWAEVIGANDIFYGGSLADHAGFPDCRIEFVRAFEIMANLATSKSVSGETITIHAPVIDKSKAETLLIGKDLGVDYSITVTCYNANDKGEACGHCESCGTRKQGFIDSGIIDVTRYVSFD